MMILVQCCNSTSGIIYENRIFCQLGDAVGFATKHIVAFPKSHVNIYELYVGSPVDFYNMGPPLHTIRP